MSTPPRRPPQSRLIPSFSKAVAHMWPSNQRTSKSIPMCKMCKIKPVFIESGRAHDYCGRTCASNYEGRKLHACLLEGCQLTGRAAHADFCSDHHAKESVRKGQVEGCLTCGVYPQSSPGGTCLLCQRQQSSKSAGFRSAPSQRLQEVKTGSSQFKKVTKHFGSQWDPAKTDTVPELNKVYEVISTTSENDKFKAQQRSNKTIISFHSAQCICNLGTKTPEVCDFKSCGICSIVKSSFNAFEFGIQYNSGRFGDGIYSYTFAKPADEFATSCTSSPYRVMLQCDTAVDSSIETNSTESLFVPTADSIVPRYVLVYIK